MIAIQILASAFAIGEFGPDSESGADWVFTRQLLGALDV
jgi:hypothetical protein